jgi:hypothetical protein
MVQLIDVVRYNVYVCSESIRQLKDGATKPRKIPNFKLCRFEDTSFRHISPEHPDWEQYQGARRECSLWLVVLHVVKRCVGAPGWNFRSEAAGAPHLPPYGPGRAKAIHWAEVRYDELMTKVVDGIESKDFAFVKDKIEPVMKVSPKNYKHVEAWVLERTAQRTKALAAREEVKAHG